jgi:membrane protease YdiL (CAAX protease family)
MYIGVLLMCGTINVTGIRKRRSSPSSYFSSSSLEYITIIACDVIFAVLVAGYILPYPSIVPWWGPTTHFVSQLWYRLFFLSRISVCGGRDISGSNNSGSDNSWSLWMKSQIFDGGPLGKGLSKVVEIVVAIILWKAVKGQWPAIQWGPIPTAASWMILAVTAIVVNFVLYFWSASSKSRGRHAGVHNMISTTTGRALTITEQSQFILLAALNAICEEVTSRWFWSNEFRTYTDKHNLCQALLFGLWHYHGIPSGWIGVGLTFIYGSIMGILKEYANEGGLFLPICAHAFADYYLFASIARGRAIDTTVKPSES